MPSQKLVHEYLILSAERYPDKEALICGDRRLTYADIDRRSDQLAHYLIRKGLEKQDRVIVFLDNSIESVISLYGILKAGGIFVILNGTLKAKKLSYIINDAGPKFLITHVSKFKVVHEVFHDRESHLSLIWVGDSSRIDKSLSSISEDWESIFQTRLHDTAVRKPELGETDLAGLIYTSGSTGEPKGVMSAHSNIVAAARSIIQYLDNREDDIILDVLPLSFDYGLYQVIMAFIFGGTVVLEKSFLYPVKILEAIEGEEVTGFPIVPTIAALLLNIQNLNRYTMQSLRYITNTAASLPAKHIQKLRETLPHAQLYSMYGLTECKRVSYLPPDELDKRPASVGKAMPNCETFIVDDRGNKVGPGEEGELVIKGPNVMRGYWNDPELTAATFRSDNSSEETLLYSGDIFTCDEDGFLYFVRRKDDLIKTKGERVSPKEIETILCDMEGVAEAAVIGVPDDILGQAVKAFIVSSRDSSLTEKKVLRYCTNNLETFMIPKYVRFVETLPKTPNGKIDRKALEKDTSNG